MEEMPPGGVDVFACTARFATSCARWRQQHLAGRAAVLGRLPARARPLPPAGPGRARAAGRCDASCATCPTASSRSPTCRSGSSGPSGCSASPSARSSRGGRRRAALRARSPVPGYAATILVVTFFAGVNCARARDHRLLRLAGLRDGQGPARRDRLRHRRGPPPSPHRRSGACRSLTPSSTRRRSARATEVGRGTRVWAFAHVLTGARIGEDCNICDGVFVENGVVVGDRVTVKSACSSGTACARGRRLHRPERDLHQRPVPAQPAVARASTRARSCAAARRSARTRRSCPGWRSGRRDGRRGRRRHPLGAAARDRGRQPGAHHRLRGCPPTTTASRSPTPAAAARRRANSASAA